MSIRVFVSSTRGDLDQDCRLYVIDALGGFAVKIDMDDWVIDSTFDEDAIIDLCRDKVCHQSSHYLGVFGFRRGWIPQQWAAAARSITEAEFDWARDFQKRRAIFLPHPLSQFAEELRRRAAQQSSDEAAAQKAFLERVRRESPFMEFHHPGHLVTRTIETLRLWEGGGLRKISNIRRAAEVARTTVPDDELLQLGHSRQVRAFEESIEYLSHPAASRIVSFLIHGPLGYDQDQLVRRLATLLLQTTTATAKRISIPLGVSWRGNSAAALCALISRALGHDSCESPVLLAQQLKATLAQVSVVLDVQLVHRFQGALSGFLDEFWRPVVEGIGSRSAHRFVLLTTIEAPATATASWGALLRSPRQVEEEPAEYDPTSPIELPRLEALRVSEVTKWLCRWKSPEDAGRIAQCLIDETEGHPTFLRMRLQDPSIWEPTEPAGTREAEYHDDP